MVDWDRVQSVGGIGKVKVMLENTNPPGSVIEHQYSTFFEVREGKVIITTRITKPGGRTYDTLCSVNVDDLRDVLDALMPQAAKIPN